MLILLRGGGDLASGVALRLHRSGIKVVICELAQPLVVRRLAAFAEAVFSGQATVEGVTAVLVRERAEVLQAILQGKIPVLVDPEVQALSWLKPEVLVDGRMNKRPPETRMDTASLVIGLGPGFLAGENCHAVIETQRGHTMGRVIWQGPSEADTGIPEGMHVPRNEGGERDVTYKTNADRVLRAPADGILEAHAAIGDHLEPGQLVAQVSGSPVYAPFRGVLRGLIYPGIPVQLGMKIGDLDPRDDPRYCSLVSDKSLAVGGGVLEAILSRMDLRQKLWE